jgi:hypothetical protein
MVEKKSVISQLQTVGEEALGKLAKTDAARNALQRANELKERAGKTLTGLEAVEKRLDAIEKRLSALEGKPSSRSRSTASKSTTASKPRTTASKASSSSDSTQAA